MYSNKTTLADVEFLVSSPNRLDVFDAVRTAPRPRHELRERIDASRVTLSRILRDLEDRKWIERNDGEYSPTPRGEIVTREVAQLFANLEALDGLEAALLWLPVELFDFDLARERDNRSLTVLHAMQKPLLQNGVEDVAIATGTAVVAPRGERGAISHGNLLVCGSNRAT
ncbi:hypothetical protein [Halopenitus persicus]|uniref:hypothetical protein n=1 Tax=Halopenitus persicus TaxID=1048396 RepID=UPI000BBABEA4|nr:hypothetical protein [Halopenitus persicus]